MAENSHEKTLAALGVAQPEQVAPLFSQLLANATTDLQSANSSEAFEKFRVHWLGRKSGVLTLTTDNWLKPATPEHSAPMKKATAVRQPRSKPDAG